jgi:hypothetical protein
VDKSSIDETGEDDIDDGEEELDDAIAAEKENVEETNDDGGCDNDVDKVESELLLMRDERNICERVILTGGVEGG